MRFTKKLTRFRTSGPIVAAAIAAVSCATPAGKAMGQPMRNASAGYEVEVLVDGVPAPTFHHAGEAYVMGHKGERYTLRVWNRTGRRIEAVVSVDGRDVIDGKPADFRNKRGYMVPAWGHVDIDGWRLSAYQAAAFRFSAVRDSYAARTGSARNVGVIGVAVFPERVYTPPPRPIYPRAPHSYPESYRDDAASGRSAEAPRSKSAPAPSASAPPSSADGAIAESAPSRRERPGLGTEFGESMHSQVREVSFVRASSTPAVLLGLRYNDRDGLVAMGVDIDGWDAYSDDTHLRRTADPFPVSHRRYAAPPPGWRR